ncbi:SDR family NAD(P)-dependent oxidoreductase [Pseudonocardia humida]|uniref:SDR family NAD(P)-dependent oxidoreductase n=1 Tax=Pseudonocardia humida TaxID=2800819 RepID=UPI00207C8097|nr:SDR family oxidoreductase [Pseudonocardia humida]
MRPTALVTGASRGLGAEIAVRLAAAGHPVVVNYASSAEAARRVVERITAAGGTARAHRADATDADEVAAMVDDVRRDLGPVGVLVLNATGPQPKVPADVLDWPDVERHLDFFVKSPVLLLRAVLPDMRAAGWGRIVHIGSDVVRRLPLGNSAYVAAKAAQLGLAEVWAKELGPLGITVNTVAPGWIPVERHRDADPDALAAYAAGVPLGRMGEPGDVAGAVAYLASDAAGFVTGAWLPVNGGSTLS